MLPKYFIAKILSLHAEFVLFLENSFLYTSLHYADSELTWLFAGKGGSILTNSDIISPL